MIPDSADEALLRLAAIVSSSDDAIVGKDLTGIVTSWNTAAERMFGYTAEEMVGRSIRVIIPPERYSEEDEVLRRICRGEPVDHFETIRRRKDGSRIDISLTVSPIRKADGTIIGASKIARDITESKRAAKRTAFIDHAGRVLAGSLDYEETLKAVANLTVPAIADWCAVDIAAPDRPLRRVAMVHFNPEKIEVATKLLEQYQNSELSYSPMSVVKSSVPVIIPRTTDDMLVAASDGDEEYLRMLRSLDLVSYICVPLIAHGRTLGAITLATGDSGRVYGDTDLDFARDVAFRAALAIDNAEAYKEVRLANRVKDDFLATLSHEIRTPLNAILGYARLLRSGMLSGDKQVRAQETIERNATVLTQIVEDVLDVSRIVSGKLRLDIQEIDPRDSVKMAVETMMPAAHAKGVRLETILDQRATPIGADADRLQQIIWNLLANAVKFTSRGGRVIIRIERVDSFLDIVVSDTGIGIEPDFIPHIFERFRQADSSTTREHGGLGLGLAICRHLVELHGGTIHASSPGAGKGSTFRVRLPLMSVRAESLRDQERHDLLPANAFAGLKRSKLGGVRVLAVDDDADALTLIQEILESAGADVTTAATAEQALERMTTQPHVIVTDIGMPVMDGFELLARIRSLADTTLRQVPAAALTAYARSEDRARSLKSGFQLHLSKPIDPEELVTAVASLAKGKGAGNMS